MVNGKGADSSRDCSYSSFEWLWIGTIGARQWVQGGLTAEANHTFVKSVPSLAHRTPMSPILRGMTPWDSIIALCTEYSRI